MRHELCEKLRPICALSRVGQASWTSYIFDAAKGQLFVGSRHTYPNGTVHRDHYERALGTAADGWVPIEQMHPLEVLADAATDEPGVITWRCKVQ
jgi:hypothetical protein